MKTEPHMKGAPRESDSVFTPVPVPYDVEIDGPPHAMTVTARSEFYVRGRVKGGRVWTVPVEVVRQGGSP